MATTLTTNLKLRVSDDLTADATYNLNRIDTNAGAVTTDNSGNLEVYAAEDVYILPQAPDKDGTGVGGTVALGTASHDITVDTYGTTRLFGDLLLEDDDAPGTNFLTFTYSGGGTDTTLDWTLTADSFVTIPAGTITLADTTTAQTLDSKTLTNGIIDAANNTITNITDAEVAATAAISGTKVDPNFGSQDIITSGELRLSAGASYTGFAGNPSMVSPTLWTLPATDGTSNQVLVTNGAFELGWATVTTDSLPTNNVRIGDGTNTSTDTDTSVLGDILADSTTGLTIKSGAIDNDNVNAAASIDFSKMAALTADIVPVSDGSGFVISSAVTATELGHLSGVTSALQTQVDSKLTIASNLSDVADAPTARTNLGLAIGSDVQAYDADLDTISALTGTTDHVIIGSAGTWTQSAITSVSGVQQTVATWANADGTSKVVTHSFGNQRVLIQIWDENDEQIFVDSIDQTDTNTVTLTASIAPPTSWTVTIKEVV